jgi:Spermidine synthase
MKILSKKWFLYLTEFFSGMSVMAVELGASRLLAPYFSSSQIVWTIIIGTIMIAMAAGNLYGGKAADKNPDPMQLYKRILVAALWIAAIPVLGKYVILGISGLLIFTVSTNFLILAAFASCLVLFVYPLFLLGTVTPSLVKATVDSLDDSGTTVGRMNACNTIGSILGTFLPTFVTIPAVGTAVTFLFFSTVLLAIALIYIISEKGFGRQAVISILIFLFCIGFGHSSSFAFWEEDLTYEGESVYNYLQVKEDEKQIVFSTNVLFGVQSVLVKDGGLTGLYYDYALAAPAITSAKENQQILVLGNGTGTFANQCLRYFPHSNVEAVEIDAAVTELAHKYFDLSESVSVTEYDGRAFLEATDRCYDVILVDAYQDITIPFQMSSLEFFTLVKEHLFDSGVLAVNLNMYGDFDKSINRYLCDTIASVFPFVSIVEVPYSTNLMLFAASGDAPENLLKSAVKDIPDRELNSLLQNVPGALKPYHSSGLLLTDDKAPVELLGMQMIDHIIEEELKYFKGIYQRSGLRGLLDSLLT